MMEPLIVVEDLVKEYHLGGGVVRALRGVSLQVFREDFVSVTGPSGSGKSTFMNLIGCLDRPTSGRYFLEGIEVGRMTSDELAAVRNQKIGFIFQGFNLLPRASALANVMLPMTYSGVPGPERRQRAMEALRAVGLGDRMDHRPAELSGGQQQRVAIARALVNDPAIVLADEPTGNLDSRTSLEIMAILQEMNSRGITILLVTHEPDIAEFTKRTVAFRDGLVVRDEARPQPRDAREELNALPLPVN